MSPFQGGFRGMSFLSQNLPYPINQRGRFHLLMVSIAVATVAAIAVAITIAVAMTVTFSALFNIIVQYDTYVFYLACFIFLVHKSQHIFMRIIKTGNVERGIHMFCKFQRI